MLRPLPSILHFKDEEENEQDVDQDDEEGDGFFVPHGYLSEGEGCENDEDEQVNKSAKFLSARKFLKLQASYLFWLSWLKKTFVYVDV